MPEWFVEATDIEGNRVEIRIQTDANGKVIRIEPVRR